MEAENFQKKESLITPKEARKIAGGFYRELTDEQVEKRTSSLAELAYIVLSHIKSGKDPPD